MAKLYICKLCKEIVYYRESHLEYAHHKLLQNYFDLAPKGSKVTPGNPVP